MNVYKKIFNKSHSTGKKFIKKDPNSRRHAYHDVHLTPEENLLATKGLILYFLCFIILIPILIYKLKFYDFLKLYFVNTDLVASALSFDKGIFKNVFKYIYNDTGPLIGFISQSLINLCVLVGIFFIIIKENCKKNINSTLSKVVFILTLTYLLPCRYIIKFQHGFYNWLLDKNIFNKKYVGILSILLGLLLIIFIIIIEQLVIFTFSKNLQEIFSLIFKLLK